MIGLGIGIGLARGSTTGGPSIVVLKSFVDFGALTLEDAGSVSVVAAGLGTGFSIDSGNSAGHFAISDDGMLSVTAQGETDSLNGSPYTLGLLGDGVSDDVTVNTSGNNANGFNLAIGMSFSDLTEYDAVIAAGDGRILFGRSLTYATSLGSAELFQSGFLSETIITSHENQDAVFVAIDVRQADNITFDQITVRNPAGNGFLRIRDASSDITVQNCLIEGAFIDEDTDFSTAPPAPSGDGIATDGTTPPHNVSILNNEIRYTAVGCVMQCTGTLRFEGNYVHHCHQDCFKSGTGATTTVISDNLFEAVLGNSGDVFGVHADFIQFAGNGAAADITGISIRRNRFIDNVSRSAPQIIFMDDMPAGLFYTVDIEGNLIYSTKVAHIRVTSAKDCFTIGNTGVSNDTDGNAGPYIRIGETEDGGGNQGFANLIHQHNVAGSHTSLLLGPGINEYSDVFVGPNFNELTTLVDIMAAFAMKPNGPADKDNSGGASAFDLGAVGSGYVTWPTTTPGNDGSLDTDYDPRVVVSVLSSPTDTEVGATTGSGSVSATQGHGTLYWVATESAVAPSAAQILAGTDDSDAAAADSGTQAIIATGVQSIDIVSLTAATGYTVHYVQVNIGSLNSAVVSAAGFTTTVAPSAFPIPETTSTYVSNSASTTSHVVTLPTGIEDGNLLLLHFEYATTTTISIDGWTQNGRIWYKTASGEGATVTVVSALGTRAVCIVHRISGWLSAPEIESISGDDPPANTPSWGSLKTLWISYYKQRRSDWSVTVPSGYGNQVNAFNTSSSSVSRRGISAANINSESVSEDPDTWGLTGVSDNPSSFTVAIQPRATPTQAPPPILASNAHVISMTIRAYNGVFRR